MHGACLKLDILELPRHTCGRDQLHHSPLHLPCRMRPALRGSSASSTPSAWCRAGGRSWASLKPSPTRPAQASPGAVWSTGQSLEHSALDTASCRLPAVHWTQSALLCSAAAAGVFRAGGSEGAPGLYLSTPCRGSTHQHVFRVELQLIKADCPTQTPNRAPMHAGGACLECALQTASSPWRVMQPIP